MPLRSWLLAVVSALAVFAAFFTFKSFTPPILKAGSIAELHAIDVNGDKQYVLIRGQNRKAPVLLFLHGGPGMPAMYLAHDFQRDLEKNFVVVHWDQRGAGKSYRKDVTPEELSVSQLLDDTHAVITYLQQKLGVEKVWLVGHSHGSYLGALFAREHPELLYALVGVGQTTDPEREYAVQDEFLKSRLAELGLPETTEINNSSREDLLFKTHSELYAADSFAPLVISGIFAPEYSLFDVMNVAKGSSFSSANMTYDVADGSLSNVDASFEIPVVIMMGVHDMVTPTSLAKEYYGGLTAPEKFWVEFDQSAHFPFYEQPRQFANEMVRVKTELMTITPAATASPQPQ